MSNQRTLEAFIDAFGTRFHGIPLKDLPTVEVNAGDLATVCSCVCAWLMGKAVGDFDSAAEEAMVRCARSLFPDIAVAADAERNARDRTLN